MTSLDESLAEGQGLDLVPVLPAARWDRFEALLSRLSDRLNPILVKEARQSLRSRQFTGTFFLMLAAGWVWSILGLAILGPDVAYSADGPSMFYAYYVVLAFPLLIVGPYSAFYSLSAERQDRTYELVSITALNARQILSGKLCGVVLQMTVYLSAIFPCLAFTYLLRGLDIFTILLTVVYTCFMALGAAVLGLLLATLSPPRQRQIGLGLLFLVMLAGGFIINLTWIFSLIASQGALIESAGFWQVNLAWLVFYINGFALVFLAARSQLTTVSQNRSTDLRIALVVTQMSMLGWAAWGQLVGGGNTIFAFIFLSVLLWYFAGIFMTGEPQILSPRVKRDLPQSLLGRVFLTWFAPGPGTGYMFVIANMITMTLAANLPFVYIATRLGLAVPMTVSGAVVGTAIPLRLTRPDVWETCIIVTSYVTIYLGLGKLMLGAIGRVAEVRLATRSLVHLMLVMFGGGIPWVLQMTLPSLRNSGYTLLQISNPVWTIWECCYKGVPVVGPVLVASLPIAAIIVWALNLPSLAAELQQVRVAKPPRVAQEDAELAAQAAGPPTHANPWD